MKKNLLILIIFLIIGGFCFAGDIKADTSTFYSSASDGFIIGADMSYTTAHNATYGTPYPNYYIYFGQAYDGSVYQIYRVGLFFDTSALPDNATIQSARIRMFLPTGFDVSVTDFTMTAVNGSALDDPLVGADYYDLLSQTTSGGTLSTASLVQNSYNDITLNSTGLSWISKTGMTKIGLRSSRDINSNAPTSQANTEYVLFNDIERGNGPYLEVTYTVPISAPTLTTGSASSITSSAATLGGSITATGGANPTVRGFQYGLSQTPTWTVNESGSFSTGAYSLLATSLSPSTTYYFRAYATNSGGTGSSTWVSFATLAQNQPPTISSNISTVHREGPDNTTATLSGNISDMGGFASSSVWFEWWTNPAQKTETSHIVKLSSDPTAFAAVIDLSLDTVYYFRSAGQNPAGTSYGGEVKVASYLGSGEQLSVNTGSSDNIRPTTAVVSPPDSSWQRVDFNALINDSDAGGSGLAENCEYMINDLANSRNTGTTTRPCGEFSAAVKVGTSTEDKCLEDRTGIRGEATCKVSTKSYDNAGNNSGWKSRNFRIDYTAPNVGRISCAANSGQVCFVGSACASAEQGVEKSFCAALQDQVGRITGCWLYIDGEYKKNAVFSPVPCENNADCGISVNYAFQTSGDHTMRFSCKDAAGNYGWGVPVKVEVTTNHTPKINSLRYTTSPCEFPTTEAGCMVNFIVSASDEDGDPLTYSWVFDDGGYSTNQNPSHHYAAISPGYNVLVTVSDGRGGTASRAIVVPVVNKGDQCTEGQVKNCGDCSSQICQSNGTWGSCTSFGGCSPESCSCPTSRCVGTNYYSYPVHGSCQNSCDCNVGASPGQPCRVTITPNASECTTLSVDLRVSNKNLDLDLVNPSNWLNSLTNLTVNSSFSVIAVVSGSAVGTINFKFDINGDGNYETTFSNVLFTGYDDYVWIPRQDDQGVIRQTKRLLGSDVFIVKDLASYGQSGRHTPKVYVERGAKSAEDSANVGVSSTPPIASISCNNSQCGPGSSCGPDIAYNRNCAFTYGNESSDSGNDIAKSVWSIFYGDGTTPWADPYLSCTDIAGTPDNEALCDLTLPPLTASKYYKIRLYVEDAAGSSDYVDRNFYVRREAIAEFECARTEDGEWGDCESLISSAGEKVYFMDKSLGSETFDGGTASINPDNGWLWLFEDGTPTSDTIQNPSAIFEKKDTDSGKCNLEITDSIGRQDAILHQVYPKIPLPSWQEVIPTEQSYE